MIEFTDLHAQQMRIKSEIDAGIARVLQHGRYILGPEVAELEEKLADYVQAKYCISCANGTDALQIALMALGVGPGDEVITPGFTYVATAETVAVLGAKPVYVDVAPLTYNLDPALLEAAITPRTKAIIPVSMYGQCADFDTINAIASKHGLAVIEDAAQSFGATYKGRYSCNLTTIACTSFFPSKPLGGYGDGGAIFTNDEGLATVMRQIARHGQDRRYHHIRIGINSRLDTLQAAILLPKLAILSEELEMRQRVAQRYQTSLQAIGIEHAFCGAPQPSRVCPVHDPGQTARPGTGKLAQSGCAHCCALPYPLEQTARRAGSGCGAAGGRPDRHRGPESAHGALPERRRYGSHRPSATGMRTALISFKAAA